MLGELNIKERLQEAVESAMDEAENEDQLVDLVVAEVLNVLQECDPEDLGFGSEEEAA